MHISFSRLFVTSVLALAAAAAPSRKDPGFVSVEDGIFKLDGKDFHFAGSNAYYFPFNGVRPISPLDVVLFARER
jgi:mannan endo-1,4-beta-mannosidase